MTCLHVKHHFTLNNVSTGVGICQQLFVNVLNGKLYIHKQINY